MLDYLQADYGIVLNLVKNLPIGSGLGSSAASAVASVFALNSLLEEPLPPDRVLQFAIEGEKIASGDDVHLDNIGACLYGGFIIARSSDPIDVIRVEVPAAWHCLIFHPHVEITTTSARQSLPEKVDLDMAIQQWANTAALIDALYKADLDQFGRALFDPIIEPLRAPRIPHYEGLKQAALKSGAAGCAISGSGPSLFAICGEKSTAERAAEAMTRLYQDHDLPCDTIITRISTQGVRVL
jgi:homoserine kinase